LSGKTGIYLIIVFNALIINLHNYTSEITIKKSITNLSVLNESYSYEKPSGFSREEGEKMRA